MKEDIFITAKTICAPAESELSVLRLLCESGERELEGRLRRGVSKEDCAAAFTCAAAWLAAASLENIRCAGEELSSLRAGDMSVTAATAGERYERAQLLRRQAKRLMEPYSEDDFCFCGVQG